MNKIIIHWTAGTYQPNSTEYEHYHFLINGDGMLIKGKYEPRDNENCKDGKYAAHTGGGNTGAIGISVCGMLGYKDANNVGRYPLKKIQCEKLFDTVADLCKLYGIQVTSQTVMTHYEFGKTHPKTSSFGKIDITCLPPYPWVTKDIAGDFIRSKVKWYMLNKR